ncbi:putative serine/threonine-protein phosphatase 4 regulatory subunit 1-like [Mus caroli]|uniref:Serine/threonine-protein phosphatase 4 regulatory subunit 1-like n=1 Tax=Mus caroli TaxID=10089 RepID=A0A6P7R0I3_MUSCR|nr:putative serine/threonine-protein phosphatase 4 regulatory subunit 1-like [Mus caroli]
MAEIPLYFVDLQDDLEDFGVPGLLRDQDSHPPSGSDVAAAFTGIYVHTSDPEDQASQNPGVDKVEDPQCPLPFEELLAVNSCWGRRRILFNCGQCQIVARGLLDVLSHTDEDILAVLEGAVRLSEDAEGSRLQCSRHSDVACLPTPCHTVKMRRMTDSCPACTPFSAHTMADEMLQKVPEI